MKKPTRKKMIQFIKKAFGEKHAELLIQYNLNSWIYRFKSPVRVWSASDYARRKTLKQMFPSKFKGLNKDANLNNQEYQIPKYQRW